MLQSDPDNLLIPFLCEAPYLSSCSLPLRGLRRVDAIAAKAQVTKKEADAIVSAMVDTIMEVVSQGNKVSLVGFGSFEGRECQAREGRNPKTGEKMQIPATRIPAFAAGKLFKEKVAPRS